MTSSNGPPIRWRIAIVAGAVLAGALLLAGWPALRAISEALVSAVEAYRWIVGPFLLLFAGAILIGVVRAVWAFAWRLDAQARQAAIVPLQNGLPIHVADVRQIAVQEAHTTLDRYYAAQLAEAERAMPNLTSFHQAVRIEGGSVPAQLPETSAPPMLPQLEVGRGTLAQLHKIGHICRSGNSLLVGYADGQPQYIELAECGFIGVGGQPRVGKSTTTLLLIEQAVLSNWHVFVGDPHITKADGLLSRCRPLSGRLARQAATPEEIAAMVYLVDKIGRRRVNGDPDRTPVILIIDEFTNLVWREQLPADIFRILPSMAIEYAGVGVHGLIISHDYSRAGLGNELGAALRRSFTHRIAHRMDPGNVEFLLPRGSSAQARAVAGLEKGHALFHGPDGAAHVAVPWIVDDDAAYASGGAPERPYAPRPVLGAQSAIPPTERVIHPPAPPTAPLTFTVQEQIISLLSARPWQTSGEIAQALAVDVDVVRTELNDLLKRRMLTRRPPTRPTNDRYEWSINQSTNPHLVVSA